MPTKQTFGLIMTTRSFFPSHLVATARDKMVSKLHAMGYEVITLTEQDTQYGAVVTYEEACKCAELFKAHREEISGIIVVLPNFGEETGVADAITLYPVAGAGIWGIKVSVPEMDLGEYGNYGGGSASNSEFGFNIGAGADFNLSEKFVLNAELK